MIASRLRRWALDATQAYLEAKADLVHDESGHRIGLRRNPGLDPMERLDAAHECEHGRLPHDSYVACTCWMTSGRMPDVARVAAQAA